MLFHRQLRASAATVWSFLLISLLSHSLLDSLTTGGRGLAGSGRGVTSASSPLAGDPGRPFKLEAYLTARGEAVILSELYWVWLPGAVLMLVLMGWRVWRRTPRDAETGGQVMKIVIAVPLGGTEGE